MFEAVLFTISGALFLASALIAFFFHKEFVGGESSKEWKFLYTGMVLFGVSSTLAGLNIVTPNTLLKTGYELVFLISMSLICLSCFMLWNKFKL